MQKVYTFLVTIFFIIFIPMIVPGDFQSAPLIMADKVSQPFSPLPSSSEDGQQWFIFSAEQPWADDELEMTGAILAAVIDALDRQGMDGQEMLHGYRFRRHHGEHVPDYPGGIAVVNHNTQEITLADAAFKRLHGFYIMHELGHIVDRRTGRQLTETFHTLAGSDQEKRSTAPGFWLNRHAENDLEEATADAFALWIMSIYDRDYRPVFAYTPQTTDYTSISNYLVTAIMEINSATQKN